MTILVLPALYGYPIHKRPTFASIVRSPRSGREVTANQQAVPLWEFELTAEVLRDQTQNATIDSYFSGYYEFQRWSQQFVAANGQYGWFYYEDLSDCSRAAQSLGTGDGTTLSFRFRRTISDGTHLVTESVGAVNRDHTVVVYLNGVATPSPGNWAITPDNTTLYFYSPVANGVVVTADFYYYYLCRFITDDLAFEEFLTNRWSVKSLRFRSIYRKENPVSPAPVPDAHSNWRDSGSFHNATSGSGSRHGGISTLTTNDLVVVGIISETDASGAVNPVVNSITSTSNLTYTRVGSVNAQPNPGAINPWINLEIWTARAGLLSAEILTIHLSARANNVCWVAGAFVNTASYPFDETATLPGFNSTTSGSGPSVTIDTAYPMDTLIWASGGLGAGTNNVHPAGFTDIYSTVFEAGGGLGNVVLSMSYLSVNAIQTARLVQPNSPGAGSCSLIGLKS